MKSIDKFLLLLFISTAPIYAGESAGQAGAFLRIGLGPKAKGMGDTYTAIADNATAVYYNPAGLAFIKNKEISLAYSLMTFDRTFNYIGFVSSLPPNAGFSVGAIQSGFKDSETRLRNGELAGENIEDTQYAVFLGFAIRLGSKVAIGICPKLLYSKVYDVSASSFGADIGVMVKPVDHLSLGLAVKELGQKFKYTRNATGQGDQSTNDALPRITRMGAAYDIPLTNSTFKNILIASDMEMNSEQTTKLHFGVETNIMDKFRFRLGIDDRDLTTGFSVPFKIKQRQFRLDYAFIHDSRSGISFGSQDLALSFIF
jgi:hypothetical protein